MPRPVKPNHPVTVRLEEHIYDKLNRFCNESGQSKTVAIERALLKYIEDYDSKQEELKKLGK